MTGLLQNYRAIMFRLRAFLEGLATAKTAAWNARAAAWKRMEMEETTMLIAIAEPLPEPTEPGVKEETSEELRMKALIEGWKKT